MITTLLSLRDKLQTAIGDDKQVYADKYTNAIKNAIRETYPKLHRKLDDMSLITGNILPPFNWATSSTLGLYTEPTGTLAQTTTAGYYRHASGSAKVTASGADDSIILDSNAFPRLLDLMDTTVDCKCWVHPEVANDAFLDIITTDSEGSDTTESSTTACSASVFTLLEIEDYAVPDDITRLRVKLRVHTTLKYAYFDPPRLTGKSVDEFLLPTDFQNGEVLEVYVQQTGYSDDICDDLHPRFPSSSRVVDYEIIQKGVGKYLHLSYSSSERRIRLIGDCPLEIPTADTSTISLDGERINLLTAYAAYLLYEMETDVVSASDVARMERAAMKWLGKYRRMLPEFKMSRRPMTLKIGY